MLCALVLISSAFSEQGGSDSLSFYQGLIDAGNEGTCAVLDNGTVRCWGDGSNGQLGYGNTTVIGDDETPNSAGPVNLGAGRTAKAIAKGFFHTCTLLDDRSVRCWGYGGEGALGYGNTATIGDNETPDTAGPVQLGGPVSEIATMDHSCAILTTGAVRCWGASSNGELGYGNTNVIGDNETPDSQPVVNLGVGRTATAISAGRNHTCAVLDDGNVRCWGWNNFGELGYGNTTTIGDNEAPGSVGPVNLGAGRTAKAIAAGGFHTCALLDDGSVRCWGLNGNGQLGYGNTSNIGDNEAPGTVGPVNLGAGRTAQAIAAGEFHTCALLDDGSVRCWGSGSSGQIGYGGGSDVGDNETPDRLGPVSLGNGRTARAITAGYLHTCALLDNGTMLCWGQARSGQLGYGNTNNIGDNETPDSAGAVNLGRPLWSSVADLSLSVSSTPASIPSGTNATITATIRNAGPNTASGVTARVVVPTGFQFVSATPSQGSYSSATGTWTVGTVATTATPTLQVTATATADGTHTSTAEVTASAAGDPDSTPGNAVAGEDDQATLSLLVPDSTPPDTTITSGPSGPTNDNTPTFAFSSSEPTGATFECRVYQGAPSGAFTSCSSAFTTAALADGAYTFEVRARDAAGNLDATPAQRSFTVDTAAPDTTIDSGPTGATNDSTPTFAFSSSEPTGATFECRVYQGAPSGSFSTCTSPFTTATLPDGSYTFEVRARDAAGNLDATPAQRSFTVDTAAPDTTISSGPTGATNDSTPTFAFSSSAGATFECRVYQGAPSGSFSTCTSPFTTATLADGAYTFEVRARDAAGNLDASPAQRSFTVDTAAPAAPTLAGTAPPSPANDNEPEVKGTAEAGSTVTLFTSQACSPPSAASGSAAAFASPGLTATVADNSTTVFYARATDAAGNSSACSLSSITYVEDSAAPDTTIDSGPSGATSDSTPTFAFSSSEPTGATFECRVYQGAPSGTFSSCTSPFTTATLPDGSYTIEVRARDLAGNTDGTPAPRSFSVDTGAPAPPVLTDTDPDSPANDNSPEVKGTAEAGTTVSLYTTPACLEPAAVSGPAATLASPGLTAAVTDNSTTAFYAKAVDPTGNPSGCTLSSITYVEDSAAPDTTIDSGPSGATSDSTPTFAFSSSEPTGATFECRVYQGSPSGSFSPCTSPHTTAALLDGSYSFEVQARDAAGNLDGTPAQRSFTLDRTVDRSPAESPDTAIVSGPSVTTRERTPTFTFSSSASGTTFECSLDGAAFVPCSSPFVTPQLRAGGHVFQVRARTAAGAVDPSPATFEFAVAAQLADLPAPSLGKSFNVEPVPGGEVFVSESPRTSRARASATVPGIKGRNFVPLREARQVAVGSILDTRRGKVRLLSARDARGTTQTGEFGSGAFQVLQSGKRAAQGLTELRLKGASFAVCRSGRGKKASAARGRRIRRLRGNAKGRFRTRGRYSAATVRGTIWEVSDLCDGTLTKVTRGAVAVRDFSRRRTVIVRTGGSYLARKRR